MMCRQVACGNRPNACELLVDITECTCHGENTLKASERQVSPAVEKLPKRSCNDSRSIDHGLLPSRTSITKGVEGKQYHVAICLFQKRGVVIRWALQIPSLTCQFLSQVRSSFSLFGFLILYCILGLSRDSAIYRQVLSKTGQENRQKEQ